MKSKIILVVLFYIILASIVSRVYIGILLMPMVLLFHYIVPGIALQKYCRYLDYEEFNKSLFSSVAVGYALAIVLYIIMLICGVQRYVLIPSIVISTISLLYIWNDIPRLIKQEEEDSLFLSIVLFVCLGLGFLGFQCQHLSANIVGESNMHSDDVFWFRNAVASTVSYPLPDLSVMGNTLFYHYFTSIAIADLSFVTGLDLFDSCFDFSYLIRIILVVGSVYLISTAFISRKNYQFLTIVLILFGTTIEELTFTNYVDMIYVATLGLAEGYAMCLFSYFFFRRITSFNIRVIILPVFLFMVAIGLKASCTLIVLCGILFYCLIQVPYNKKRIQLNWIILGLVYLLSFLLIMFLFVWNVNPQMSGDGRILSISIATAFRPSFFASLYSESRRFIPVLPVFLVFLFYIIVNYYLYIIGSVLIYRRRNIIEWKSLEWPFLVMFLGGNCLFLFINQLGFSQSHFYFISIPFGILLIISILEKNDKIIFNRWESSLIYTTFLVAIICFVYSFVSQLDVNKFNRLFSDRNSPQVVTGSSLSSDELDALTWAKENIDKHAILVSNKIFAKDGSRSFVVSSYTEHQTYLEGYLYSASAKDPIICHRYLLLKSFFLSMEPSALSHIKKEGVTHVVLFKNIPEAIPQVRGDNIFENNSVIIYQI